MAVFSKTRTELVYYQCLLPILTWYSLYFQMQNTSECLLFAIYLLGAAPLPALLCSALQLPAAIPTLLFQPHGNPRDGEPFCKDKSDSWSTCQSNGITNNIMVWSPEARAILQAVLVLAVCATQRAIGGASVLSQNLLKALQDCT